MSRARLLSLPALAVVTAFFALGAVVSGQLIGERGGALGTLEWVARTGVVVFGALALVGWFAAVRARRPCPPARAARIRRPAARPARPRP
jgi:uncharacterized membrane protein